LRIVSLAGLVLFAAALRLPSFQNLRKFLISSLLIHGFTGVKKTEGLDPPPKSVAELVPWARAPGPDGVSGLLNRRESTSDLSTRKVANEACPAAAMNVTCVSAIRHGVL